MTADSEGHIFVLRLKQVEDVFAKSKRREIACKSVEAEGKPHFDTRIFPKVKLPTVTISCLLFFLPSALPRKQFTMLQVAVRAAIRPAAHAARFTVKPNYSTAKTAIRTLSTTTTRLSADAHHVDAHPPGLYGVGAPPGEMPSDEAQATGLARLELLGEMQGINVFDEEPLDASRLGTFDSPVQVFSLVRGFIGVPRL